jgi:DNA mismatch endonuclease (patch repair protein)
MPDTFSIVERSKVMSAVKSKNNNSTELALIRIFRKHRIKGWRRNYKVIGKPDFVFFDKKIAVFADGCFWHGHHCRNITPNQNRNYWDNKRKRNIERDLKINEIFKSRGWTVLRFWECDIKKENVDISLLLQLHRNSQVDK